jgi:uncharacterized membrane protein YdbT with pleckstrin-like domain
MDLHEGELVIYEGHPSWRSTLAFYLKIVVGFIRRYFTVYTITNQRLRIQRGIVSRDVQQTQIERVQNVNTSQGIIQRMLVVGTVDFDTAGTGDADFKFIGVNSPERVVEAVDKAHHANAQTRTAPSPDAL